MEVKTFISERKIGAPLPSALGDNPQGWFGVRPAVSVFDENVFVALHHLSFLGMEFYLWSTAFYSSCFPAYDPSYDRRISTLAMESFVDVSGDPSVAG